MDRDLVDVKAAAHHGGTRAPRNLAVMMREAFVALNDLVIGRLAERGHAVVRPAHGAVFQYLDDTGTTVSSSPSAPR